MKKVNKNLIIIHEKDHEYNEEAVIGVADSIEKAESMIEEYYGKGNYKTIAFDNIMENNIEYIKVIEIKDGKNQPTISTLILEWVTLNET